MLSAGGSDLAGGARMRAWTATFEADGYVHLPEQFTAAEVAELGRLRELAVRDWCLTHGTSDRPHALSDVVERHPAVGLAAACRPTLLGLAESVMGPFVQLDSCVLVGDPPVDPSRRGRPVCWHRDRFGFFPLGVYTRPLAVVAMVYIQDMTSTTGPLRVIPRSHVEPVAIDSGAVREPHSAEIVIHASAGDVVMLHHNLLHSGTHNTSNDERRFLGIVYSLSCLRQGDNFSGPNCSALLESAHRARDRRILRLLGADPLIVPRQNSGFVQPHPRDWSAWFREDEEFASPRHSTHG